MLLIALYRSHFNEKYQSLKLFANVRVIVTKAADYFVSSQLDALRELDVVVYHDCDEWPDFEGAYKVGEPILHIEMRRWADLLVIAPLDANTLAKIAHGFCDNLLTSTLRAWDWSKPVLLCPAMNTMMWENKPTPEQIHLLQTWGAAIINPIEKTLACKDIGMGAMASVEDITMVVKKYCEKNTFFCSRL
jgi:phosphopantothenoylcysteine decarboxylase